MVVKCADTTIGSQFIKDILDLVGYIPCSELDVPSYEETSNESYRLHSLRAMLATSLPGKPLPCFMT